MQSFLTLINAKRSSYPRPHHRSRKSRRSSVHAYGLDSNNLPVRCCIYPQLRYDFSGTGETFLGPDPYESLNIPIWCSINQESERSSHGQGSGSGRTSTEPPESEDADDIIRCSIYPQLIGKSFSRTRPARPYRTSVQSREDKTIKLPTRHSTHQQLNEQRSSRSYSHSVEPGYSTNRSGGNELPIRSSKYLQLQNRLEPARILSESSHSDITLSSDTISSRFSSSQLSSSQSSSSCTYTPPGLPHNEYQSLIRRQRMDSAREVLSLHFAHRGGRYQSPYVTHAVKRTFECPQDERRQFSKVKYAMRKAQRAGFNFTDEQYKRALRRHAADVRYCEMSDVDGIPISQKVVEEFVWTWHYYEEAKDTELTAVRHDEPATHAFGHHEPRRSSVLRQGDSGIITQALGKRPPLVSKFSWDSDSDEEVYQRRRLTKTKR
jgi:hypothetical protein